MLYKALLGLGMIIEINILKCNGQYLKFIHMLAILMIFLRHNKLCIIALRCLQESLSSPGVKMLLHLLIAIKNSSSENDGYKVDVLFGIFFSISVLTC